jgi:hypothetical protein
LNLPLFSLYLRRAMHPALLLVLVAVALVASRSGNAPETALLGAENPEQLARGMMRREMWFLLCAVLLPVQLHSAGQWTQRVRDGDGNWLSPRALSSWKIVLTSWFAIFCGSVAWLVAIAATGELAAGGGEASYRVVKEWPLLEHRTRGEENQLRWTTELGELPPGSRGRLSFGILGNYGDVEELVLRATPLDAGSRERATEAHVRPGRRGRIEVELPPGEGNLLFEFSAVGATAALLVESPRFLVSVPAPEWSGTTALLGRLALAAAAWLALALGLGAWISAPSSVLLVAIFWGGAWERGVGGGFLPGAELPRAFAAVAEGRVPASLPPGVWGGTLVCVAIGLILLRLGLRRLRCAT